MVNNHKWYRGHPNNHLSTIISNSMSSVMYRNGVGKSINEINSHGNMVVVGNHAMILADTGNKVDVIPFTPYHQDL